MTTHQRLPLLFSITACVCVGIAGFAGAQDRFEKLPGFEKFQEANRIAAELSRQGRIADLAWSEDGKRATYRVGDQWFAIDLTGQPIEAATTTVEQAVPLDRGSGSGRRGPARGRQFDKVDSPDGIWTAEHRAGNLVLVKKDGSGEVAVTTDGGGDHKYATGSWVYGEELDQNTAMWWSPDSSMIAFYEFDESNVRDFYVLTKLTDVNVELYPEAYPKPGQPNPVVGLRVYHLESGETVKVDVGENPDQYVYTISWRPREEELIYHRTNRHQNVLEVMAADPATGDSRVVVTEQQETWQENSPTLRWLADGERFVWESERAGYKHYELRHADGSLLAPLTSGDYPCNSIERIDEEAGWLYYTAFSSQNPLHVQLHRVRLDGSEASRLTPDDLNHTFISISPDHSRFIAMNESVETPPTTHLFDMWGHRLLTLAKTDTSAVNGRGVAELFSYKADDGVTDLYGILYKPSDFDPSKKYPLLIDAYGGPLSQSVRARWSPVNPYCEFGMLIAEIDNRGTRNRGKAFEGAVYQKLGIVDIKDQVDGVAHLAQREYVDASRVGITGHSYGGYLAALGVLKYPDVFHVAVAGAPVTDWRNYDTIYTERFMRTPQENPEGYAQGSCLTFADQLKGKLLLLHGMEDDNVHPSNSWQLIHKLQQARKPFDMMFFPTSGHGIGSPSHNPVKWEYLVDHLVGSNQ